MDPRDDQGKAILSSIWPLTGISLVFLLLRIYCKFKGRRGLWWDDHVMILAWVRCPALFAHETFKLTSPSRSLLRLQSSSAP